MLITFKCTACGQLVSFNATEEEIKKATIFPFPVVIQHGDHAQVVYLDRALGIREVEVARHAETLLDHFIGFINEAILTEKECNIKNIGISIGTQIGDYLLTQVHDGRSFMRIPDELKNSDQEKIARHLAREWQSLWETFTSAMKSVFSGGNIEYLIDLNSPNNVRFTISENPFCRTMIGEKKEKSCEILAGILIGAAESMRGDDIGFDCTETECIIVTGKRHCKFDLRALDSKTTQRRPKVALRK